MKLVFFKTFLQSIYQRKLWIWLLILGVGALLRFYNLETGMHYLGDEGRDAIIIYDIVTAKNFPLIGPPMSVGNVYLGPLYFYLVAPFLALFRFNPIGPAVFTALLSLATSVLLYLFVNQVFKNRLAGWLAAWFYAISPIAVRFGRWGWNPHIMPFFVMLFIFSLWKILEEKRSKWWMVTGLSLGFILQSHYLGLAAIPILLLAFLIKRPQFRNLKYPILGTGLFILLMSPLLVFDIVHDWLNIRGFWEILTQQSENGFSLLGWLSRSRDRLRQVFGDFTDFGERSIANNLMLATIFITWIINETEKKRWWLVGVWLGVGSLFLGIYRGSVFSHYLEFLLPACSLVLGVLLAQVYAKKKRRILAVIVFLGLSIFLIQRSTQLALAKPLPNIRAVKELVTFIKEQSQGEPFNFALLAENNYDGAYQYFFNLWNISAKYNEATGQLFVICEGEKRCQPQGNAKWEIAVFEVAYDGQVEIEKEWQFYDFFRVFLFKPKSNNE